MIFNEKTGDNYEINIVPLCSQICHKKSLFCLNIHLEHKVEIFIVSGQSVNVLATFLLRLGVFPICTILNQALNHMCAVFSHGIIFPAK